MNRLPPLLLLLFFVPWAVVSAEVYKWVDEEGNTHYGDQPKSGAEKVKMESTVTTYTPPPLNKVANDTSSTPPAINYKIDIVTPTSFQTFFNDSNGTVRVALNVNPTPDTETGAKYIFYLDGKAVSAAITTPNMQLSNLVRGAHKIKAWMYDKEGRLLAQSTEITFYIKKETEDSSSSSSSTSSEPDYASTNKASSTTYKSSSKPDYTSTNKADGTTYKSGSKADYSSTNKAGSSTYKPSFSSGGYKAK
jgi:hypothetical protein